MKWLDVPPVWLTGFAVLAWLQSQYVSFDLSLAHPVTLLLAGLFVGAGIVLTLLAVMEFRRHKTTIIPHETPDSLIQSGVFGRSRNPIYLADVLILAGLCLWWDAILALALVPILVWVLERRFIVPEENRMRRVFRADFARYEQKVRRWL
ncbi:isoprenylcysteine carboxylmethyltransferase family protein [Roseobacter sp.]|uniref:methyltransferase family protein n=1 Tax=Roseobacter sp. TaxID=1907202 RepID=UPI002965E841|nr:isoprenylcysteine carboxylmethyltransferase family protein [Roseobacter sp.]MDW3184519.1 isoprenylcysteine carboxylmethyltransferase family protein [Roseobacter sp.]